MNDMKRINIYLTKQEREQAKKVSNKYRVCLSTIADKCAYWLLYLLIHYSNEETTNKILNEYLQKQGNYKTSIKQKDKELLGQTIKKPSKYYSNALKIYLNHDIKKYIDNNEAVNKYYQEIDRTLQTTIDQFWNYNENIRMIRRAVRENPSYFERAIKENGHKKDLNRD